jgi:F-type H+-transporting ATPase subunit epsilon
VVGTGFIEVTGDSVSVLTDSALGEEEIDENATEEAIKRAQAALRDKNLSSDDTAEVEASLARSLAQIRFKRRRQH